MGRNDRKGMILTYIYIAAISIGIALVPYFIAAQRGSNKTFWLIMGLVFGPLAIPFVFFAKTRKPEQEEDVYTR